jgi:hypothetical protein
VEHVAVRTEGWLAMIWLVLIVGVTWLGIRV